VIAGLANFFNGIALPLPPLSTLTVLWARQAKGKKPKRKELLDYYKKEYADTAERMVKQLKAALENK